MASNLLAENYLKFILVGDARSGKTSILRRYLQDAFLENADPVSVDYGVKTISWNNRTRISLQVWKIAGQERMFRMSHVYYRDVNGAMVVADLTRLKRSLQTAVRWKRDIDAKARLPNGRSIPAVLLLNKSDRRHQIDINICQQLDLFCRQHGFLGWFATSPKANCGIEDAFRFLIKGSLDKTMRYRQLHDEDATRVNQFITCFKVEDERSWPSQSHQQTFELEQFVDES